MFCNITYIMLNRTLNNRFYLYLYLTYCILVCYNNLLKYYFNRLYSLLLFILLIVNILF